jgi:DNA invertase Pin-like site-specific DNA recombinase
MIGYARVSTTDQDTRIQEEALRRAGCERVYAEKASGKSRDGRDVLAGVIDHLRTGDTLVVVKLDRLGRSTRDVLNIVHELEERGAHLRVLEPELMDTSGVNGRIILTVLSMVAEMERTFIRDRQRAGIEKAKANGVYKGRPPKLDHGRMKQLAAAGAGPTQIAREFRCSRGMVYKVLGRP